MRAPRKSYREPRVETARADNSRIVSGFSMGLGVCRKIGKEEGRGKVMVKITAKVKKRLRYLPKELKEMLIDDLKRGDSIAERRNASDRFFMEQERKKPGSVCFDMDTGKLRLMDEKGGERS